MQMHRMQMPIQAGQGQGPDCRPDPTGDRPSVLGGEAVRNKENFGETESVEREFVKNENMQRKSVVTAVRNGVCTKASLPRPQDCNWRSWTTDKGLTMPTTLIVLILKR